MIINDLNIRIINADLTTLGYDVKYNKYSDLIDNAIKERGYNRILSTRFNVDNIVEKTDNWLSRYQWNISKILDTIELKYNPLNNYDGTETETIATTEHTDTNNYGERVRNVNNNAHSDITEYGVNEVTVANDVSAFNNASLTRESETSTNNKAHTDSVNYGATTQTDSTNAYADTMNYGATTQTRTLTKGGNLGVTTSQQMLISELDMTRDYNQVNLIADMWIMDFTVGYEV